MGDVYKAIGRLADQNIIVLITVESGTGKELVARAIYQHSRRSDKPLPRQQLRRHSRKPSGKRIVRPRERRLHRRRIGKSEQCNGGTFFLDEVGDMPLATRGKILRLLQDQKFERVGGNETIATDVRVFAATNRDLKSFSEQGNSVPTSIAD